MTQSVFTTIDPTTKSGTQLATDLDNFRDSSLTQHAGSTRPSYAVAKTIWVNDAAVPWVVNMYDGADDIQIGVVNPTTNIFTPSSVQNSPSTWGGTAVASTVGTWTMSLAPTPTAYVAGQKFSFIAPETNAGAVTINVNSLGAKAITKNVTTTLAMGDIVNGILVEIQYDGTQFQLLSPNVSSSILMFGTGATTVPDATTRYFGLALCTASTTDVGIHVPFACTISRLYGGCPGATTGTRTYKVLKNGVATALTFAVTGATYTGADTSHSVTFAAGDFICIEIDTSGGTEVVTHFASVKVVG